ncbi:MAG: ATP-grasp domain-containing protein, partial [Bdellovibrionales bacterium]|nr:ATP-grasp domain-containing protein [Bdellovibrionales bacterium]
TPGNKKYPKIVKLLNEESSRGITDSSVVHSVEEEKIQIDKLKNEYDSTIFTEEYIRGREIHVAVLMRRGQYYAAPLWETTFGRKKGARIISEKVKWNFAYRIRVGVELVPALNIGKSLVKKIQNTAIKACRALEVTGHARVDIRLTQDNKIYVLEVNPNPEISYGDEFAECIRSGGTEYDDMIKGIVMEALR